jgi:transposase
MDTPETIRSLVIDNFLKGMTVRGIANVCGIAKSTVNKIIQHYKKTGLRTSAREYCGKNRLLPPRTERLLRRESVLHPSSTARQIQAAVGGEAASVSICTIKRALRRQGRLAYRPTKAPLLSAAKMRVRLEWCKAHISWSVEDWKLVGIIRNLFRLDRPTAVPYFSVSIR